MTNKRDRGIAWGYVLLGIGVLYLYVVLTPFRTFVDTWNEYLATAVLLPAWIDILPPISLVDFAVGSFVSARYRNLSTGHKSWFEIFLACTLMAFGGTTLTGVLTGQPPLFMTGTSAIPGFLLAWWLTFYSPDDIFWRKVSNNPVFNYIIGILVAIACGHAVTSWGVDKVYFNTFHANGSDWKKAYYLNILAGTLAASGGGIFVDVLNIFSGSKSFTLRYKSSFFAMGQYSVSVSVNRSFWLAFLYYYLIADSRIFLPSPAVTTVTGHSIIAIIQVVNFLMNYHVPDANIFQEWTNKVFDFFGISPDFDFSAGKDKSD